MPRQKTKRVQCLIFPKERFKRKLDALYWCSKNKKQFDLDVGDKRDAMKKVDGEYTIQLRPRCRFENTRKENVGGVKILKGFLS